LSPYGYVSPHQHHQQRQQHHRHQQEHHRHQQERHQQHYQQYYQQHYEPQQRPSGGIALGAVVAAPFVSSPSQGGGGVAGELATGTTATVVGDPVLRMTSLSKTKSEFLMPGQRDDLQDEFGFPRGLADELGKTRSFYPVRFWILDNSGSMMSNDGASVRGNISVPCTRWAELTETVHYHANMAGILQATSFFRMLNDPGCRVGPQEFSIADQGRNFKREVQEVRQIVQHCQPFGATPLTAHLVEIGNRVAVMEQKMRKKGVHAVVIIATDGLPTSPEGMTSEEIDQEFIQALKDLQALPVWVVIRLCTDEQAVVDFYNRLDSVLELPLEVLDDFFNEAKEIHQHNRWLNYAMPLHRCREVGYQNRIFDLLDERPLNKDEVKEFCLVLFGSEHFMKCPDVHSDWNGFLKLLTKVIKDEKPQFNPITKRLAPWIDVKALRNAFGGGVLGIFKRKSIANPK
jgi:hypothetical protein